MKYLLSMVLALSGTAFGQSLEISKDQLNTTVGVTYQEELDNGAVIDASVQSFNDTSYYSLKAHTKYGSVEQSSSTGLSYLTPAYRGVYLRLNKDYSAVGFTYNNMFVELGDSGFYAVGASYGKVSVSGSFRGDAAVRYDKVAVYRKPWGNNGVSYQKDYNWKFYVEQDKKTAKTIFGVTYRF